MPTSSYRLVSVFSVAIVVIALSSPFTSARGDLDGELRTLLEARGFTGRIESTLEQRLGRRLDGELADLGRLLWFDTISGLRGDNSCAGCHSPAHGFGDSQSIAIGVQNNFVVGRNRSGPRNQRRSPTVINAAFYRALMWNGRFFAPSGDPFDNSFGFTFPEPEGTTRFPPGDAAITHLLHAQAHIPPTELVEVAGFTGTAGTIAPEFDQFDDGQGAPVPPPDERGFRNEPIRRAVLDRLNATPSYRQLFGAVFPAVRTGAPIDFTMFAKAITEFEFTLTFANAPIDQFARGDNDAMSVPQKKGAIVFFGSGRCTKCHAVAGRSNEMFSDFESHVIGVPQVAPLFGMGTGNVLFDGPERNEDFGLEQITGKASDRYKFRTTPLRNVGEQAAFFHNGAFVRLEDAIRHHLDVFASARSYNPIAAGLSPDLTYEQGPIGPVLQRVDAVLAQPLRLSAAEVANLVAFVGEGLLDDRAKQAHLCGLIPDRVPSNSPIPRFQGCPR